MKLCYHPNAQLVPEEIEAAKNYGQDSTFFHAVAQGRQTELASLPKFVDFCDRVQNLAENIDRAIRKSALVSKTVLYSGHGQGASIRGALCGEPRSFVGLRYSYSGYISTSSVKDVAVNSFLAKRMASGSKPTLLEFHLPAEFPVLDMGQANSQGEFEYLLGRSTEFKITEASYLEGHQNGETFHFVMEPA